jgi:hypothetical protein
MERRGEHSELATQRAGVLAEQVNRAAQEQAVRSQMRPEKVAWQARPTHELLSEMLGVRAALERNKAVLEARKDGLQAPRVPSRRQIENGLSKREFQELRRAKLGLNRAREGAIADGISARSIAKWFADPAAALLSSVAAGHRRFDRLDAADRAVRQATTALEAKRAWVRSDAGQAQVSNLREPAVEASVAVARQRRAIDRRTRRLGAQIVRVERAIRDLGVALHAGIARIEVPGKVPRDGTREEAQVRYVAAIAGPVRTALSRTPKPLLQRAFKAMQVQAAKPEPPRRGGGRGPDWTPDF